MGLDQYWFADKRTKEEKLEHLISNPDEPYLEEIGYHRKFWDLQKFIDTDNCEIMQVEEELLSDLKAWCDKQLKSFEQLQGEDDYVVDEYQHLDEVLHHVEICLDKGYLVFYQADW